MRDTKVVHMNEWKLEKSLENLYLMEEEFFDEQSEIHPSSPCFGSGVTQKDVSYPFLRDVAGEYLFSCMQSPWAAFTKFVLCLCSNKKWCAASAFQAVAAVVVVVTLSS